MYKTLCGCALMGGCVVFFWSLFSWMAFPWHAETLHRFKDEAEVAKVLRENVFQSGIHVLPNTGHYSNQTPIKEIRKAQEILKNGPLVFASIELKGMKKTEIAPLLISLISHILAAGIISWMLLQTEGLCFLERTIFVVLIGVLVVLLGVLPSWNWWHFSIKYTLVSCVDILIAWTLAGLLIAKLQS